MRSRPLQGYDLLDAIPMCQKGISNQRAMASPGNRLGAHNGGLLSFGNFHQLAQASSKLAILHVVGKAAKAGVAPSGVWSVISCASYWPAWARTCDMPQPTRTCPHTPESLKFCRREFRMRVPSRCHRIARLTLFGSGNVQVRSPCLPGPRTLGHQTVLHLASPKVSRGSA